MFIPRYNIYQLLYYGQEIDHLQNVAVDVNITSKSVPIGGRKAVDITRVRQTKMGHKAQGPRPKYIAYVFTVLGNIITGRLYKLTLSDQAKVTVQLTVMLSDSV
jgi:hypothetical protein